MTLKRYFCCGLALIGLSLAIAIANVGADDPVQDVSYGNTGQESVFVTALNEYRATRGLHPVGVSAELSSDCRGWSTHMRQRGQLSHDSNRGGGMEICAQITEESGINALQAWQRSPAHNAILLSSRIDTIGIGSDGIWWTMRGIQRDAERSAFHTTETSTEAADDMIGRIPMSVSRSSVQRIARDVQKSIDRTASTTTDTKTEIEDMVGQRVPMSVSRIR